MKRAALSSLGFVGWISLGLACAPLESNATRTSPRAGALTELPSGTVVESTGTAGVASAIIDPYSLDSQIMKANADSNISDVVLAFRDIVKCCG